MTLFTLGHCSNALSTFIFNEFINEKAIEIARIYVLEEFQGKKIGTIFMNFCIDFAKKNSDCYFQV